MEYYGICESCGFDFKSYVQKTKCPNCGFEIPLTINLLIALKREEKGFSLDEMLKKLGWPEPSYNHMSYWDIELHEDELLEVIDFIDVKNLFRVLGIDWEKAFEIIFDNSKAATEQFKGNQPLNEIIQTKMSNLGFTEEQVAEKMDYLPEKTLGIQRAASPYFDKWTLSEIKHLCDTLGLNASSFVRKLL